MDSDVQRELERLDRRLLAVELVPMKVATLEVEFAGLKEDVGGVREAVDEIRKAQQAEAQRRDEDRKLEQAEKKKDRRWWFASALTSAGLVISAVALLADKL